MLIIRSPLRITLGGGGTDVPSYYREHEGFLIAATIDKYVYITVHETFLPRILLKYSKMEEVTQIADIQHPIFREALRLSRLPEPLAIEITSMADIPDGTGLGSSGSFTTALVKALASYARNPISAREVAEAACHIELDCLNEPIGKQDQYAAAFGGVSCFTFQRNDHVDVAPLAVSRNFLHQLEDHLLLFFTGFSRRASSILKEQDEKTKALDASMIENLHHIKALGKQSHELLLRGDIAGFGGLMHEHWEYKKQRAQNMSNPQIDHWYECARRHGAIGGKLIGAGGGGFLMFCVEDKKQLRRALEKEGLREVRFQFEFEGTKRVV